MPSKTTLNAIAAVLFVIAAVLLFIGGSTILGILFAVLAVLSVVQLMAARRRPAG
jgi:membrane protein implicated in regulation of membrane protease activity